MIDKGSLREVTVNWLSTGLVLLPIMLAMTLGNSTKKLIKIIASLLRIVSIGYQGNLRFQR